MKALQTISLAVIFLFHAAELLGDTIIFKGGPIITGRVLLTNDDMVLIQRDYGTFNYPTNEVKSIRRENGESNLTAGTNDIAAWDIVIADLAGQPWAAGLKQVSATLIDRGIFRNVPYLSFRCGVNYELNIYGDPANPAGIEMGIYGDSSRGVVPKQDCLKFISSALRDPADGEVLKRLKLDEDVTSRDNLIFEVTPPTAADAYGGWWISVYDENQLNAARASASQLRETSEPLSPIEASAFHPNDSKWMKRDLKPAMLAPAARRSNLSSVSRTNSVLTASKSSGTNAVSAQTNSLPVQAAVSGSDTIQVRGYHRKDGTYVAPHTRKRTSPKR